MNIFFTASVRGGREHQPEYAAIVEMLERHGTVLSAHIADDALSHYGETDIAAREVLEREEAALQRSDIVIAEVTTPSFGVGYLLGRATALGKRVVALYGGDPLELSAILKGDPRIEVRTYRSGDIEGILDGVFVR